MSDQGFAAYSIRNARIFSWQMESKSANHLTGCGQAGVMDGCIPGNGQGRCGNDGRLAAKTALGMPLVNEGCGSPERRAKHLATGAGCAVDVDQIDGAGHDISSCET